MRFNKIVKALAVALPLLAVSACSTTDTSSVDASTAAEQAAADAQAAAAAASAEADRVKTAALAREAEIAAQTNSEIEQLLAQSIIYFGFDKSTLSSEYSTTLDAHARFLSANASQTVVIEGHADESGTPEYNIALGERRAKAVASYLESLGVSSSQISVVSYGEEKPMVRTRDAAAFAKNRRAVLVY